MNKNATESQKQQHPPIYLDLDKICHSKPKPQHQSVFNQKGSHPLEYLRSTKNCNYSCWKGKAFPFNICYV